jgi:streptogramin lyase
VIWFIDINHNALGWINPANPTTITEIPLPANLVGVTTIQPQIVAGPGGWLFFTEANVDTHSGGVTTSAIGAYNPANPPGSQWLEAPLSGTPVQRPYGIALGPDHNVWFTAASPTPGTFGFQSYAVGMASLTGNTLSITSFPLTLPSADTTLFPNQISAGPDGNMWFDWVTNAPGGSGGAISSINPASHAIAPAISIPTSVVLAPLPAGITAGPDGNVWFADRGGALGRVTLDTSLQINSQPPASVAAASPFGLTVGVTYSDTGAAYSGSVTVSLQANPGGSTLGGTTTVTAVNGVAAFSGLTLNNAGNGYTLQVAAAGASPVTTGGINVTSSSPTVTTTTLASSVNPSVARQGVTFTATVQGAGAAVTSGSVTFSVDGVSMSPSLLDGTGRASFTTSGLPAGTHVITATYTPSVAYTSSSAALSQAVVAPPSVIGFKAVFTQKRNAKGKPVGKPVFSGFEFDFSTAMNRSAEGNPGNYTMFTNVVKRVGRKSQTVPQQIGLTVSINAAGNVVLMPAGRQTFTKGGKITLNAGGLVSAAGASLVGRTTFNISPGGKGLS